MPLLEPLFDAETLAARVAEMGREIRADHADVTLTCIGVLKGAIPFMGDLLRAIDGPVTCEYLGVSSYHGTRSTGAVRITHDLQADISGKHCLLVEDIVDTGLTLSWLVRNLQSRGPASLSIVTLLDKPSRRQIEVPVDYCGFQIPDAFVVGYGLDLDQLYRNLPYVAIYHPDEA